MWSSAVSFKSVVNKVAKLSYVKKIKADHSLVLMATNAIAVIWQVLIVNVLSWGWPTKKIKCTNIYLQQVFGVFNFCKLP